MILQRIRIIVGDAEFEPRGPLPQKSGALPMSHQISKYFSLNVNSSILKGITYDNQCCGSELTKFGIFKF